MREITVLTHRRPEDIAAALERADRARPPRPGVRCASTPKRPPSCGLQPAPGLVLDADDQRRRRAVRRARRRRHDPARRSSTTRGRGCPCSRSTSARSASWRRSSRRPARRRPARAATASSSCCTCPRSPLELPDGGPLAPQRRRDPPQGRRPRRRAGLLAGRRGGRQRALRRPRRRHACGLDGLQPRQRRPGDGLGGGRASWCRSSRPTR